MTRRVGLLLAILVVGGAVPGAAVPVAAPAAVTPVGYRTALAPIADCAAFARAWPTLPDARALLRHLFDTELVAQGPKEGDDAFMDRAVKQLFATLGDPSRLVLRTPVPGQARYDAGRQIMVLSLPAPFEAELDRWGRHEVRIRGAAPLLTETQLHGSLEFEAARVKEILLPMSPADATRFPAEARLQTLSVFQDYGTDASHQVAQGAAAATQTSYRLVRLRPKCALITMGDRAFTGWMYDAWNEPTTDGPSSGGP